MADTLTAQWREQMTDSPIPVNDPPACKHGKAFLQHCPECEASARWRQPGDDTPQKPEPTLESVTQERDQARESLQKALGALAVFAKAHTRARELYAKRYNDNDLGRENFDKMPDKWPMVRVTFTMGDLRTAARVVQGEK